MGVGHFFTEFGALYNSPEELAELESIIKKAEKRFISWSYWQMKYYNDITTSSSPGTKESFYEPDGSLQKGKVEVFIRPYFHALCGHPLSTNFNRKTLEFKLEFIAGNCAKNSEAFLPESLYPKGMQITFSGCEHCNIQQIQKNYYEMIIPKAENSGQKIKFSVKPK